MADIFLSHSSLDNPQALALAAQLRHLGFESVFLDFDPESGIPAGLDWEAVLYEKLKRSRAVIVLYSVNWCQSRWCFAEFSHARILGRSVIPVRLDGAPLDVPLARLQCIELSSADAIQRVVNGLHAAGVGLSSRRAPDPKRPPFPGLAAFQSNDASVFFGRDDEVRRIVDRLAILRLTTDRKFVLLTGPSGSGKSSLLLAGVIPALRAQTDTWSLCDPIRAGTYRRATLERALAAAAEGEETATRLISIDQFEEALAAEGERPLLRELSELLKKSEGRVLVVATIRSDAMSRLENSLELSGLAIEFVRVDSIGRSGLKAAIEEPCDLCGIRLDDGLAERMANDCGDWRTLPALAYTLREMYERSSAPRAFTSELYDALGGVTGILNARMRALIEGSGLTAGQVRSVVFQLVELTQFGGFQRARVARSKFAGASDNLIDQMDAARVLVSDDSGGIPTIELAHDSLLLNWGTLAQWLEQYREFFVWRNRFDAALARFKRSGALLESDEVAEAERWGQDGLVDLDGDALALLKASREQGRFNTLAKRAWMAVRVGGGLAATWWLTGKGVSAWLAAYQGPPPVMVPMAAEGAAMVGTQTPLLPSYAMGVLVGVFSLAGVLGGIVAFGTRVASAISGIVLFFLLLIALPTIAQGDAWRSVPFALTGCCVLLLCVRALGASLSLKWTVLAAMFGAGLWAYLTYFDFGPSGPPAMYGKLDRLALAWDSLLYSWLSAPSQVRWMLSGAGVGFCAEILLASGSILAVAWGRHEHSASAANLGAWYTGPMTCAAAVLLALVLGLAPLADRQARRGAALRDATWAASELPWLQRAYRIRIGHYASSMKDIERVAWDWARDSVRYCELKMDRQREAEKRGAPPTYDLSLERQLADESALEDFVLSTSAARSTYFVGRFDTSRIEFLPEVKDGWAATISNRTYPDVGCTVWDGSASAIAGLVGFSSAADHIRCTTVVDPPRYVPLNPPSAVPRGCNDVASMQFTFPEKLGGLGNAR